MNNGQIIGPIIKEENNVNRTKKLLVKRILSFVLVTVMMVGPVQRPRVP